MAKYDDGEFELVLGNKQLLSAFFIVVILFGVFFTMGYIVGRSGDPDASAVASAPQRPAEPAPVSQRPSPLEPAAPASGRQAGEAQVFAGAMPADERSSETVEPSSQSGSTRATWNAAEAAREVPTQASRTPVAAPAPAPAATLQPAPSAAVPSEPARGQIFLQVAAVKRPEAELLGEALRKKGFEAQLAPVPGQDLLRVLVGPLSGQTELATTKASLEDSGFKPMVRKY